MDDNQDTDGEIEKIRQENSSLTIKIAGIRKQSERIFDNQKKCQEAEARFEFLSQENSSLKKRLSSIQSENASLLGEMNFLKSRLESRPEQEELIKTLESTIYSLQNRNKNIVPKKVIEDNDPIHPNVLSSIKELDSLKEKAEIAALQTKKYRRKYEKLDSERLHLDKKYHSLKDKYKKIENEHKDSAPSGPNIERELEMTERRIQKAEAELASLHAAMTKPAQCSNQNPNNVISEEIRSLKGKVEAMRKMSVERQPEDWPKLF